MISIIIPIYKAEAYIEECLSSIQKQTFTDFEVLCIIDGSPDNSAKICQQFVDRDDRFKIFTKENGGVCSARNLGLSKSKGEYVCFIDADDAIESHYLEILHQMSSNGSMAICSYARDKKELTNRVKQMKTYNAHEYIKHVFDEDIEHPNIWMMLFRSSIIQKQHLDFYVGCIKNEDTEFYIKYMAHEKTIVFSDYKGYFYRVNPTSVMNSGLNMKSLTSIEAQARMADYLVRHGVYPADNSILSNAVQVYVYSAAKSHNLVIYDYLHEKYPVKMHMHKMLVHPRIGRKVTAICYLTLGKRVFYKLLSSL